MRSLRIRTGVIIETIPIVSIEPQNTLRLTCRNCSIRGWLEEQELLIQIGLFNWDMHILICICRNCGKKSAFQMFVTSDDSET